jgi:hypothetical protein
MGIQLKIREQNREMVRTRNYVSQGSFVSIMTALGYGLDDQGFEFR